MSNDNVTQALASIRFAYKAKKALEEPAPTLLQHMGTITSRIPLEYQLQVAHDKAARNLVSEIDNAANLFNEILKPTRAQ